MEWDNDMIVVLKDVRISPPYTPDNCEGSQIACDRIKKQVWLCIYIQPSTVKSHTA